MTNYFLVFSNGEKIGDGIIKLTLLYEINRRFPTHKIIWVANGTTVYANRLKSFSSKYIYKVIEHANLNPFFWKSKSKNKFLNNSHFEYIFDTQKAVPRTVALKRLAHNFFISSSAKGFFSNSGINLIKKNKKYYLDELLDLLNSIKKIDHDVDFKIPIPKNLDKTLRNFFPDKFKYLGIAPGAGEKNKIWPLENFIKVAKEFEKKSIKIVWFLGPEEQNIKSKIIYEFPKSLYPEESINNFSSLEIIMGSTKYLSCALANDSGISHILSTKHCPLIKLFGPKNALKFTPQNIFFRNITSSEFHSDDIKVIPVNHVISAIDKFII